MKIKQLIEKIEGEATLHFELEDGLITHTQIEFYQGRGVEDILVGRPIMDALVLTPRVCGICGHAHLITATQALEDIYSTNGTPLEITDKAKKLRELTLNFEILQSHFKWLYLTLIPSFSAIYNPTQKQQLLKATYPANILAKAIAVIGGQWPHNSYSLPGGVVSDVTNSELIQVKNFILEVTKFFQSDTKNDIQDMLSLFEKNALESIGQSYDRFIAFGGNSLFQSGKANATSITHNINTKHITEVTNKNSIAKNVLYKEKYYEVGSLSRMMLNNNSEVKDAHRHYKDSIYTRVISRGVEMELLLQHSLELLNTIDAKERSYIKPKLAIESLNGSGEGRVEAARGSLIHTATIKKGVIQEYQIITPTQWNLSNGEKSNPAVAQKAMVGLSDTRLAEAVFKTFDVCSVCTTQ